MAAEKAKADLADLANVFAKKQAELETEIAVRERIAAVLGEGHEPYIYHKGTDYTGMATLAYTQHSFDKTYSDFRATLTAVLTNFPPVEAVKFDDQHYQPNIRPVANYNWKSSVGGGKTPILTPVFGLFVVSNLNSFGDTTYCWFADVCGVLTEIKVTAKARTYGLGEYIARELTGGRGYDCYGRPYYGGLVIKSQALQDSAATYTTYFPLESEPTTWDVATWVGLMMGDGKVKKAEAAAA